MPKDKYITGFRWLAIYQIGGGVLGILLIVYFFLAADLSNIFFDTILFIGLVLYSFSIYCGVVLYRTKSNSLVVSLVCQSLQAVGVSFYGFSYKFVSGLLFSLILENAGSLHVRFGIYLSNFSFVVGGNSNERGVEFNMVAIGIIFVLNHAIKSIDREKRGELIDSIGS